MKTGVTRRFGPSHPSEVQRASVAPSPEWQLIEAALQAISGFGRGVLYDVPRSSAPRPVAGTPVFLHGSAEWAAYLRRREQLDDGELTLLLSLRTLTEPEQLLVLDWGNTFANAFVLVEPRDPTCDLTEPSNAYRRRAEHAARAVLARGRGDIGPHGRERGGRELDAVLREGFGVWLRMPWPRNRLVREEFLLSDAHDTVRGILEARMRRLFPTESFEQALVDLLEREPELFSGRSVAGARAPFATRLGLPMLHDIRHVDRALRALVNDGRVWLFRRGPDAVSYHGPDRPVPDDMPAAEFERLIL